MNLPNGCGCCEGIEAGTPVEVHNRPGLSAIAYRVGTHARFKRSMLARLSSADLPALRGLNTRDENDFAVALLDAWATVADVLTFYSESIANESYLRTATERLSLLQLARLIGYELAPGVAANTHLAFELEDAPGAPGVVTIGGRTRVQSLPGQDELPQMFETAEEIEARPEWNVLRPRRTETKKPDEDDTEVYLKSVATGLSPGDGLLLVGSERAAEAGSERWDFRRAKTVTADPDAERTRVSWDRALGWKRFGQIILPADTPTVYALRQRAALFGHNAPDWRAMPTSVQESYHKSHQDDSEGAGEKEDHAQNTDNEWPGFRIDSDDAIDLDALYTRITQGSWVVLSRPDYQEVYEVEEVEESSRTDFTLTAKTTHLKLRGENLREKFDGRLRDTVVYAQSEPLEIAEYPFTEPIRGNEIILDRPVEGLVEGRTLIFSGEDENGGPVNETATLQEATPEDGYTKLRLTENLVHVYRRDILKIHANVARSTHGETRQEVLGGGDASTAFQSFVLREAPLTRTSATTPSGTESSLEVRVNDIEWHEAPDLYGRGPDERVFVARTDEAGRTTVRFGDGRVPASPPARRTCARRTARAPVRPASSRPAS